MRSHGHSALARLVPLSQSGFASEHWGRQPLVSRSDELLAGAADLLGRDDVDELVSRRGLRTPFLRVARDGRTLGDREFTAAGGVGAGIADQVSDDKLLGHFAAGATIVLQGLHRTWGPIIDFAQQLADELGHPVQANAYVTPRQSRGFDDHYDVHDVFVVQTSGEKQWRLRPPVRPAPLRDDPWTDHRSDVEEAARHDPVHEFTLRPGDVLYLPRGWIHSATALGGVSTHVTIGVHVWTRRHLADELATLAVGAASRAERVRSTLPLSPGGPRAASVVDDVEVAREALVEALQAVPAREVVAALQRRWRDTQRAAPVGPLAQVTAAEDVGGDSCVRLRPHLDARLGGEPDGGARLTSRLPDLTVEEHDVGALIALVDDGVLRADMVGLDLTRRLLLAGLVVLDD
ncbi:cupin domain-containing protein [Intrasporangium sp. YIM S08009]|uniref:cupin domain-containing protein n=1 Tax=Intrasporangium zincisolvens TaxID=3080018 RepID=UPI002B059F63|nr:cupin domain-containing protein [Intrasporangium sp. YIM S08009]